MTIKVQHKRSAVKSKVPLPTDLEYGEIAVNYEATDPALYVKDSANAVRRIGIPEAPDGTADGTVQYARQVVKAGAVNTKNWVAVAAIGDATEAAKGVVELATAAETTAGTDGTRAVHPAGLKVELDKLKLWTLTGTTLTAKESGGTQRGASLDFATCLANGGSKILTDINTHFVAEYKSITGQVLPDMSGTKTSVVRLEVSGVDTIICIGSVAFCWAGGGPAVCGVYLELGDRATNVVVASAFQGVRASGNAMGSIQMCSTVHVTKTSLDPTKTYVLQLLVNKIDPQGPVQVLDPNLSLFAVRIKA
jgi:hypothetical protein